MSKAPNDLQALSKKSKKTHDLLVSHIILGIFFMYGVGDAPSSDTLFPFGSIGYYGDKDVTVLGSA
jgi:hypothetical protein